MNRKRRYSLVFFILTLLFFYLPLMILIVYSFNDGKSMTWNGFSLRWYQELFLHYKISYQIHSLINTL